MWFSSEPHTQPRAPTTDSVSVTVTVILSKITNRILQDPIPSPLPPEVLQGSGPFPRMCVSRPHNWFCVRESLGLAVPNYSFCTHSLRTTRSVCPQASQFSDYRFFVSQASQSCDYRSFVSPGLTVLQPQVLCHREI